MAITAVSAAETLTDDLFDQAARLRKQVLYYERGRARDTARQELAYVERELRTRGAL